MDKCSKRLAAQGLYKVTGTDGLAVPAGSRIGDGALCRRAQADPAPALPPTPSSPRSLQFRRHPLGQGSGHFWQVILVELLHAFERPLALKSASFRHILEGVIEFALKKRTCTKVIVVKRPIIIGIILATRYEANIERLVLLRHYEHCAS